MKIEVSNAEIVDKLTIIEIKLSKIKDESKLHNLKKEYNMIKEVVDKIISHEDILYKNLYNINLKLWDIEDKCREHEKNKDFGKEFIEIARSVYFCNDERSQIKRAINIKTQSSIIEEKSYEDYK